MAKNSLPHLTHTGFPRPKEVMGWGGVLLAPTCLALPWMSICIFLLNIYFNYFKLISFIQILFIIFFVHILVPSPKHLLSFSPLTLLNVPSPSLSSLLHLCGSHINLGMANYLQPAPCRFSLPERGDEAPLIWSFSTQLPSLLLYDLMSVQHKLCTSHN